MKSMTTERPWRGVTILAGALLFAIGCAEETTAPADTEQDRDGVAAPVLETLLSCKVDVSTESMDCGPASPAATDSKSGPQLNLIVGGQHQFVRLESDQPAIASGIFEANVTVQNLTLEPLGTADGSTPHPEGVRVFFVDEPNNGVVITNHDGEAAFLGSAPTEKYYQYDGAELGEDEILSPGEVSGGKSWKFELNGAEEFRFSLLVSATAPDPDDYAVHLTRVVARGHRTCGETSVGKVYCWGHNSHGQLGDGTKENRSLPVEVKAPPGVTLSNIALGYEHTCAEGSNGKAYCWGKNNRGALGDSTSTERTTPVEVRAPEGVQLSNFALGIEHSCAEGSDGSAYCWGNNQQGSVGTGGLMFVYSTPVKVKSPGEGVKLTGLAAGPFHTCAEGSDGNTYCWGTNMSGQLGNNSSSPSNEPVRVSVPEGVRFSEIRAGSAHNCASGDNGKLYCWGNNQYSQLGNGTTDGSLVPVEVQAPAGVTLSDLVVGNTYSLAKGSDGKIYSWGSNGYGQLGDGTTSNRSIPDTMITPAGVALTELMAGGSHACARGDDGKLYCWGDNQYGQLGDGTTTPRLTAGVVAGTRRR